MGAWGTGIAEDDTVSDVIGHIVDQLKTGVSLHEACADARVRFRQLESDEEEGPLLWLALATVQWKYGEVQPEVLRRVTADVAGEKGLDRWREDPKLLARRKEALTKFVAKITKANPRPSRPPRLVTRRAPFNPGDCLIVQVADGRFTAALVLAANNSLAEYGRNLVAGLDYLESVPPGMEVFERRPWLRMWHGAWDGKPDLIWFYPSGFRRASKRITLVGNIPLRESDPKDSQSLGTWTLLGQRILQCRAGH
jgi:hypothetical protein